MILDERLISLIQSMTAGLATQLSDLGRRWRLAPSEHAFSLAAFATRQQKEEVSLAGTAIRPVDVVARHHL
jgi:hypothetical protein